MGERNEAARNVKPARTSPRSVVGADASVAGFRQARAGRRSALVEDYVELIADLIDETGGARQVEIAARLGVAQPTVAKMLKRLHGDQLVVQMPYKGVALTEAGRRLAAQSRERHKIVEEFLVSLGVPTETARCDAEGIEHHVSQATLDAFAGALAGRTSTKGAA